MKLKLKKIKAETTPDLQFEAWVGDIDEIEYDFGDYHSILKKIRQQYPQSAIVKMQDDDIEIRDTRWEGRIKWAIDIDARNWGLSDFFIVCYPSVITCTVDVRYFATPEDEENYDYTDEAYELKFNLQNIDAEIEYAFKNKQVFITKLDIYEDDTALCTF